MRGHDPETLGYGRGPVNLPRTFAMRALRLVRSTRRAPRRPVRRLVGQGLGLVATLTAFVAGGAGAGLAEARAATFLKGPYTQDVGAEAAVVRVELDAPAPLHIDVGGPSPRTVRMDDARVFHSVRLADLAPGTRYELTVRAGDTARSARFVTPPAGPAEVGFLVYGDNRTDAAAHAALVGAMDGAPGDFLLHTGDFVDDGGSDADWQAFFDVERDLLASRPLFGAVGNHELVDRAGARFVRYFGPEGALPLGAAGGAPLARTFRWGQARFFLLNAMARFDAGADRAWLERALADADAEADLALRVVVLHHGPWSSGPHGANRRAHDGGLPALLRAHRVDLVLAGHDHLYERGLTDGLPWIVSGGGGAPLYRVATPAPGSQRVELARHFVRARLVGSKLALDAIRSDGSRIERCELTRPAAASDPAWSCDDGPGGGAAAPAGAVAEPPPGAGAVADTPAGTSRRCGCGVAGAPAPSEGAAGALVAVLGAVLLASRRARGRRGAAVGLVAALGLAVGCAGPGRDELLRAKTALEQNDHERALAFLRDAEPTFAELSPVERATYAYVRGMTDYRIGFRLDARHWLAVALAYERSQPGTLPIDWRGRAEAALDDLERARRAEGYAGLAGPRPVAHAPR